MVRPIIFCLVSILGLSACSTLNGPQPGDLPNIGGAAAELEQAPEQLATITPTPKPPKLPVIGPAPEWQNETWINAEGPIQLAELQGKVVLLEFWTFG